VRRYSSVAMGPSGKAVRATSVTLHQLEIFAIVAREGSFTRAGEALLRSEAAVSQQIKLLEAAVGAQLLSRAPGRPVRITEAGRRMLASCEVVFQELDRTLDDLDALRRLEHGDIVLGSGPYFGSYVLPPIYASFQHRFPHIRAHVRMMKGIASIDAVRNGDVELAVVGRDFGSTGLSGTLLARKDLVLIAPADNRLASAVDLGLDAVVGEELILAPSTSLDRLLLDRIAAENGLTLRPAFEISGVEAQVNAVLSGLGVAAVPYHVLSRYDAARFCVLAVRGFPIRGSWSIVWRDEQLSPAGTLFRDHLLSHTAMIEATSLYRPQVVNATQA